MNGNKKVGVLRYYELNGTVSKPSKFFPWRFLINYNNVELTEDKTLVRLGYLYMTGNLYISRIMITRE